MRETVIGTTALRLQQGDLTALAADAIVFYARESLELGTGFGTAIQVRGGDTIKSELQKLAPIQPGEAVVTTGGRLKARHIIHACGPKFQEPGLEDKLRRTVRAALAAAVRNGLKSVAFPPMGAGFCGVPLDLCAKVMIETISAFLASGTPLAEVTICVIDRREFAAFDKQLGAPRLCTN